MDLLSLLFLAAGAALGGTALWMYGRAERAALDERLQSRGRQVEELTAAIAAHVATAREQIAEIRELHAKESSLQTRLEEQHRSFEQQKALLAQAEQKLADAFKALSSDALRSNNDTFLKLAKATLATFQAQAKGDLEKREQAVGELVKPLKESLERVAKQVQEVEKVRKEDYGSVTQLVRSMQQTQLHLQKETGNLVNALRTPGVRGRWGEIQLRRVVEMAGMVAYCDFEEQAGMSTEDGRRRPDMVIRLPNGRSMVVDSKATMHAYLESLEAPDEAGRRECLQRHARQVRDRLGELSGKGYAAHLLQAPDFVVLFLPGEMLFSAALEADPLLIEGSVQHNVVLATPTTLIALLRAVHYGWRQEQIAEKAQEISRLGRELYERTGRFAEGLGKVGDRLNSTVKAYNTAVGSFEARFLVSARRFHELGAAEPGQEIARVPQIESMAREVASPDPALPPDEPKLLIEGDRAANSA